MSRSAPIGPVSALVLLLACSCSGGERSATLSLLLRPGMEKNMRFTTEQDVKGAALGTSATPASSSVSFTYGFRVVSVSAGLARVELSVRDVALSKGAPVADAAVDTLRRQHFIATIDACGRILDVSSDLSTGMPLPGLPTAPGSQPEKAPAVGDLGALFRGFTGKKVSVGETWSSPLPESLTSGLRGSIRWTLASLSGTIARLDYTGTLSEQQVPIPGLPADERASLVGDASGFVELDRETGWPRHGQSVIRASVTLRAVGAPAETVPALLSMRIVSRFDELP